MSANTNHNIRYKGRFIKASVKARRQKSAAHARTLSKQSQRSDGQEDGTADPIMDVDPRVMVSSVPQDPTILPSTSNDAVQVGDASFMCILTTSYVG